MENYDPKKDIDEFKENNNIKNRMNKIHQLYEKEIQFDKKMKYLKNFCEILSKFIDTFDTYKMDNDTVFEKYYLYLQGLFESYNLYFSKLSEGKEDKNYEKDVIKKISLYFNKISALDSYYIKSLIDKLRNVSSDMFQEIVVHVIEMMTKKGKDILNTKAKWSKYKAKMIFNDVIKISSNYINEDELNSLDDLTLYDKWEENLKQCKESIKIINASTKTKIEGNRDNISLYIKKPGEDEEHIELVLDNYREALQELENDNQKFDLELEAIILANIGKIKYKYLNHENKINSIKEIQYITSESIRRAIELVNIIHKNVESTNWYKEIKQIDMEIQEFLLIEEERSSGGFQLQIKKIHKPIFDELENQFKNSNLQIIKFILDKYPPNNYQKNNNKTIDEQWEENKKKLVNDLSVKYALDNYPHETDEEKLRYIIMSVISSKVNAIYNEIK